MPALNLAAVSLRITEVTGHAAGTFEHESCMGRVLAQLANGDPAPIGGVMRMSPAAVLTRDEFLSRDAS